MKAKDDKMTFFTEDPMSTYAFLIILACTIGALWF